MANYGKPWTYEEDRKLLQMRQARISIKEIADELGRTRNSVETRWDIVRKRHCIAGPKLIASQWTDAEIERMEAMFCAGKSDAEIAAALGRTEKAAKNKRTSLGIVKERKPARLYAKPTGRPSIGDTNIRMKTSHTGEPHTWPLVDGAYMRTITAI